MVLKRHRRRPRPARGRRRLREKETRAGLRLENQLRGGIMMASVAGNGKCQIKHGGENEETPCSALGARARIGHPGRRWLRRRHGPGPAVYEERRRTVGAEIG